jgi:hypothetical protein
MRGSRQKKKEEETKRNKAIDLESSEPVWQGDSPARLAGTADKTA